MSITMVAIKNKKFDYFKQIGWCRKKSRECGMQKPRICDKQVKLNFLACKISTEVWVFLSTPPTFQ